MLKVISNTQLNDPVDVNPDVFTDNLLQIPHTGHYLDLKKMLFFCLSTRKRKN